MIHAVITQKIGTKLSRIIMHQQPRKPAAILISLHFMDAIRTSKTLCEHSKTGSWNRIVFLLNVFWGFLLVLELCSLCSIAFIIMWLKCSLSISPQSLALSIAYSDQVPPESMTAIDLPSLRMKPTRLHSSSMTTTYSRLVDLLLVGYTSILS